MISKIFVIFLTIVANNLTTSITQHDAYPGEAPYIVSIRDSGKHYCAGTIITDEWVLTAGDCYRNLANSKITVQYGISHLSTSRPNVVKAYRFIKHSTQRNFNFAILQLKDRVKLTDTITLNSDVNIVYNNIGKQVILYSWGVGKHNYKTLQHIELVLNDTASPACAKLSRDSQFFCATDPNTFEGICTGEYGSPLMLNGVQIGFRIKEEGSACSIPHYFYKLSFFKLMSWLHERVWHAHVDVQSKLRYENRKPVHITTKPPKHPHK